MRINSFASKIVASFVAVVGGFLIADAVIVSRVATFQRAAASSLERESTMHSSLSRLSLAAEAVSSRLASGEGGEVAVPVAAAEELVKAGAAVREAVGSSSDAAGASGKLGQVLTAHAAFAEALSAAGGKVTAQTAAKLEERRRELAVAV